MLNKYHKALMQGFSESEAIKIAENAYLENQFAQEQYYKKLEAQYYAEMEAELNETIQRNEPGESAGEGY